MSSLSSGGRRCLQPIGLLLALAMTAACGGDDDGSGPGDEPTPGAPDSPSNGVIEVDQAGIRGQVDGDALRLSIPVTALSRDGRAKGSLGVGLVTVDGAETRASEVADYDLESGEDSVLEVTLPWEQELEDVAELVELSVHLSETRTTPLRVTRSLLHVLRPPEVQLEGSATLREGKTAVYRVQTRDPIDGSPVADQEVDLVVTQDDDQIERMTATTDDVGSAVFEVEVDASGSYQVSASTSVAGAEITLEEGIEVVAPDRKILLTTDKPIYQPGQTIHLRALALQNPGNAPLAEQDLTFEIEDGKGNKIFKRDATTDEFGIASTTFAIARVVNMGNFKIRALMGELQGEKTVEVSRYVLPKFEVQVGVDRGWYAAGQQVHGTVDARYFFGKDVAGARVTVEASTLDVGENVFERVMGMTDADGRMDFTITLPDALAGIPLQDGNALVNLRVTVVDTADQEVQKERAVTVAAEPVDLALVPESTELVPGIENRVHLFASDPLGAPVIDAEVEVTPQGGSAVSGRTDAYGHLLLTWTPGEGESSVQVRLTPEGDGDPITRSFDLGTQNGEQHVLVRTDQAIYGIGDNVHVDIFVSSDEQRVYVDWINQGQPVDMRTLEVEDGRASFDMAIDTGLLGENRIEAYVVDDEGIIARSGRSVVARSEGTLSVSLETDRELYAPGEPAELTFSVVDEAGDPVVAALGVQIVDEAVFAKIDARPGLLKTFFELEEAFAEPTYEIHGPRVDFQRLLFEDTARGADPDVAEAAQLEAEGSLAALGGRTMGIRQGSWPRTVAAAKGRLEAYLDDEKERIARLAAPIALAEIERLEGLGCELEDYWCEAEDQEFSEAIGAAIASELQATDFWGVGYGIEESWGIAARLTSAGPDEQVDTDDDLVLELSYSDLSVAVQAGGADAGIGVRPRDVFDDLDRMAAGDPTGGVGDGVDFDEGGDGDGDGTPGGDDDGEGPRVRSDFPETLYVNPALITDGDGRATISLDMADSITEWRVSSLANAISGKLGGGQAGITVFQDFFVDVNFPAEMTRGDEVEFPIVVYNYLMEDQAVRLELEAGDWYTALGETQMMVDLAPGEVRAVGFPVRVDTVGRNTLTVRAFGTDASDAVARSVRVAPDGMAVPLAQSGSLEEGAATLDVSFPENAVPGSPELYLEVYPAFLSQAVNGLDSLLQEPYGCFEQTTSTTWPNVLVTRYMEETDQSTPEIALKAETLISAGYQRLLTFEHSGGGFSWFGEQDPEPFLSVTAFGLMEFSDMAEVHAVDAAMIDRTRQWLLDQQAADGSYEGDVSEFFSFQTSTLRNTAFVVWAIASSGYSGPETGRALDYVKGELAPDESDPYTLALVANAFAAAAPGDSFGDTLLSRLDELKQEGDGMFFWDSGDMQTNFYAEGNDADTTATALATHAMITAGGHAATVAGALDYLTSRKDATGNFGSTQATVWTLKTLLLAALQGTEGAVGTLDVALDDTEVASVELTEDQWDVMTTVDMGAMATTGDHSVALTFAGEGKVSYNLVSRHHVPWSEVPAPSGGPLSIEVGYDRTSLAVDETVQASVGVTNTTGAEQNMILVTVGLPPGFELLGEDLQAHIDAGELSRFEKTGKQLILYLSRLEASETRTLRYRLRATMPVRAADGGAEAYPYYQPDVTTSAESTLLTATDG
ncbi:MAG: MG2 domain-containing protein [Myxococcales bacterium]